MTASDHLSPAQFLTEHDHEVLRVTNRSMTMMRPSELVKHADGVLGDDSRDAELAGNIAKQGYRPEDLHLRDHIHLVRHDAGAMLANGNHRVRGLYSAGDDRPVPVLVTDRRND